ncbi:hypothetical protein [Pseudoalteromonas sp. G4]|uniref:hypothetical protein n=1 Tax=Pseudoalteromonas sp. G4 TaxID=2992761 RepID=UPI00237EC327|nr:hypothetical protein [Pseudoalteromonas sp. G4]MDE3271432.1 hypothetical protein [Pseudoalteromonas sp. G4]
MTEILSLIESNPQFVLCALIVLIAIIFFNERISRSSLYKLKTGNGNEAHLKLFEMTASQLIVFQSLLGEMIYRHKSVIADELDNASKVFLEDINAVVELNNPKKEAQLKKQLLQLISDKRQVVANDRLKISLAVKQLELLASNELALCIFNIQGKVLSMIQHTDAYLTHLVSVAESPFDSRLQTKLALSDDDQEVLLALGAFYKAF